LPTKSSVTYLGNLVTYSVHNGSLDIKNPTVNGKEVSFAPGAINTFTYNKETYEARFNLESGKFAGYYSQTNAKHYITSTANTLPDWEVNSPQKSSAHLNAGMTLVLSPNPGTKVPWVAIGTLATAGYLAYNATVNLLNNVSFTLPSTSTGDQSGFVPAVTTVLTKTLNDLVPGSLKRQKKWDDGYATKTPDEIDQLAKGGDDVAKTMKKIYEQSKRLLDKVKNSKKK
jgi:hypothetical protein